MRLPKLKLDFEYERKAKDKPKKIPKAHVFDLGRARKLVIAVLVMLFLYFGYVLFVANATAQKNHNLDHKVTTLSNKLKLASAGTTSYNPLVGQYLGDFLTAFYTVDTNNQQQRSDEIAKYFAKNMTMPSDAQATNQRLKTAKLKGLFMVDDVKTAQFDLTVTSNNQDVSFTVNVPYAQNNAQVTVVGMPYVANPIDSKAQIADARLAKTGRSISDTKASAKIQTFTKQFLSKYVSSTTKEMSMMMNDPVGLDGAVELVDVGSMIVTGSAKKAVVTTSIIVKVKGSELQQVQNIRLELQKQSSTYFVTKLIQA
ncbi:conjugal transfer protein [Weissella diestrammenae]|uniref:Conjugal transfer protein n=1 Tax=Weissella diestrammenae TaxID=1162633 RepID=A0A7G9T3P6_9LACO|nr:conjugal transfer protein [Weissella diestrammenae]MCM0582703.1 conjugal transfer protein [Weissella diestrammenae]QNN74721.1 conjugal transfer protein [Weissella diestrammenae]